VRELRMLGSVRGALSNGRPYRDKSLRDARQILRSSPMQKGRTPKNTARCASPRKGSMRAALAALKPMRIDA
jgi:hypothetical protein